MENTLSNKPEDSDISRLPEVADYSRAREKDAGPKPRNPYLAPFRIKPFLRSFSYRDMLTCFIMALVYFTVRKVMDLYSSEDFIEANEGIIKFAGALLVMAGNHAFYRAEHGRPNSYAGRWIFTILLYLNYNLVFILYSAIASGRFIYAEAWDKPVADYPIFIVAIGFLELFLSLVKRGFTKLGWQVY